MLAFNHVQGQANEYEWPGLLQISPSQQEAAKRGVGLFYKTLVDCGAQTLRPEPVRYQRRAL